MPLPNKVIPLKGQESVWDYPRPPKLERITNHIRILFNNTIIADTNEVYRVLEKSHPPGYYLPLSAILPGALTPSAKTTYCEWKGAGSYYDVQVNGKLTRNAAWFYNKPSSNFGEIKDYVSFYAGLMEACYVDDERVTPQPGEFYGGWITQNIVGPFKGAPGSWGW